MKQNQEVLSTLLKTIQIGQTDIRSVLNTTMRSSLRNALKDQLQEYDSIETEAYTLALQRALKLLGAERVTLGNLECARKGELWMLHTQRHAIVRPYICTTSKCSSSQA